MDKKEKYKGRQRLFQIIQIGNKDDILSLSFDIFIAVVIVLSCAVMFMKTFSELDQYRGTLNIIENITLVIFTIEYLLRIFTADYLFPDEKKPMAVLKFMISFDGVIELLTILPFFFLSGFVVLRMLRVVRILHLFRINASYDSFSVIKAVLYETRSQLVWSVFIIVVLMMASSLGMYSAEHSAQPEAFPNAFSGLWWSVSAMLTVGYGDIYPITTAGRILAIIVAFLGVGVVAIPTGIISAGFVRHYNAAAHSAETPELEMQTVVIDIDSAWLGRTVAEVDERFGAVVVVMKRHGKTDVPKKDVVIQTGDALTVFHR